MGDIITLYGETREEEVRREERLREEIDHESVMEENRRKVMIEEVLERGGRKLRKGV